MLDVNKIKKDFPVFVNNPGLVYLDSTATSLKPRVVIEKLVEYYEKYPANIKRGIYKLSERATSEFEESRQITAEFIGAQKNEIVFTRNTTESINLVAYSLGREIVSRGDEVAVTVMDHHSNFVPWQTLAFETGADFKVVDVTDGGVLDLGEGFKDLDKVITRKTKIFALPYVSNALGTVNPIKQIIQKAKNINPSLIIVVDAAQAVPHLNVDVKELDCDFLAFSYHKMLGPTGVGVLWGRRQILEEMFPFQYGGEMIEEVTIEGTRFAKIPEKFEAGTPAIAEVIAAKEAIRYLTTLGLDDIRAHEKELVQYAIGEMKDNFGNDLRILGPESLDYRAGIVTFVLGNLHPHDISQVLDEEGVAIRAGHHCAMPLHKRFGLVATARASFYVYNNKSDVDKLIEGLKKAQKLFG